MNLIERPGNNYFMQWLNKRERSQKKKVKWICAASHFIALIPSRLIRQMLQISLELNS